VKKSSDYHPTIPILKIQNVSKTLINSKCAAF